jgi:hypothetical protein
MRQYPQIHDLRDRVLNALDAVCVRNRIRLIPPGDWTGQVFVEIKNRLASLNLECQAFQRRAIACSYGFIDAEFLYDFTAHIYHGDDDHFLIQTVIAGESEWSHAEVIDFWDFHKLLQSDALLCFFVFEPPYEKIVASFDRLIAAIKRKQSFRCANGLSTSAYLISCRWDCPQQYKFTHRFIDTDSSVIALGEHPPSV